MHSTTPTADLSDRDNKETLVVKEEDTYDADAFEKVEVEVGLGEDSEESEGRTARGGGSSVVR